MRKIPLLLVILISGSCVPKEAENTSFNYNQVFSINKNNLIDKIKGGWLGQVVGCTYGGPTEFQFNGTMINDYTPLRWDEDLMLWYYENSPGLYDDVYMDLTFVDVFDKEGLDAPASSHALAFANAEYMLWHANQAARYNILNGIMPPESGFWTNNPHSEDIDFQIEADFAGLMSPGMVNSASEVCDKIGHIMNYGDGWYGGVYVAAMYSLAFINNDVTFVVKEALRTIPEASDFYSCIKDVIDWHAEYPDDWKQTWYNCQLKWSQDIGCPDGVFRAFNIDAKINAAYIVIGLLYGDGDFGKTIDISTRCGQDSDCNPASAAGILGTMIGYGNIPDYWKQGLEKVEDMDFRYTTISLNDVYEMGSNQALGMIEKNGGKVEGDNVIIKLQEPIAVRMEKGFPDHMPVAEKSFRKMINQEKPEFSFDFEGKGFILTGGSRKVDNSAIEQDLHIDVYIDGQLYENAVLPIRFQARRHEITWKYELEDKPHNVKIIMKEPLKGYGIWVDRAVIYK